MRSRVKDPLSSQLVFNVEAIPFGGRSHLSAAITQPRDDGHLPADAGLRLAGFDDSAVIDRQPFLAAEFAEFGVSLDTIPGKQAT